MCESGLATHVEAVLDFFLTFEKQAPMWTLGVGGSPLDACLAPCGSDDSVDGACSCSPDGDGEPGDCRRCPDRPRCRGGACGPSPLRESLSDLLKRIACLH